VSCPGEEANDSVKQPLCEISQGKEKRKTCENGEGLAIRRSSRERSSVERYAPVHAISHGKASLSQNRQRARFYIAPTNEWQWLVKRMNCCVRNTLGWRGGTPLPRAPNSCWLLPCKDDTAVQIAEHADDLRDLGWKLLTCPPHVVSRIGNKANLHSYAAELGMLRHLPQHYEHPEAASYPCMLKASVGEHGKGVHIVESATQVAELAVGGFKAGRWLLQECCPGRIEHATSLLVKNGHIVDFVCTNYEYDKEVYVWPYVEELKEKRLSHSDVPQAHLVIMKSFLAEFTGICNFNYKVRPDGGMCIFEVNARVGADLACDVPRRRAAQLFNKLDTLGDATALEPKDGA